jgi:hypothetical protein
VKEVPPPAMSAVGGMEAPEAKVTPFQMQEGDAEEEKKDDTSTPLAQQQQERNQQQQPAQRSRLPQQPQPLARPPPDGQALLSALHSTQLPPRAPRHSHLNALSSQQKPPQRPPIASVPAVDPITYHRPPPLYPRSMASTRVLQGQLGKTPYDWLEGQERAELEAFLFHRKPGRAPTRKGRQAGVAEAAGVSAKTGTMSLSCALLLSSSIISHELTFPSLR